MHRAASPAIIVHGGAGDLGADDPASSGGLTLALILLLIVVWGALVASLAQLIGQWPILVQAAFYLVVGIIWIIPLKPLVRWIVTGSNRTRP